MSFSKMKLRGLNKEVKDKTFSLLQEFIVGRSPQCDLFITDLQASRRQRSFSAVRHAFLLVFVQNPDRPVIMDEPEDFMFTSFFC